MGGHGSGEGRGGLIVEIGDGDTLAYRGQLFYDLVKVTVSRLAYGMAEELHPHGVAALAVTPGYMRTETVASFGSDVPVDRPVVRRAYVLEDPLSQPPVAPEPPGAGQADPAQ